jgi:DNA repair protein RadC
VVSREDREIIYKIKVSGELLGIELLDAVIVVTGSYYSFAESAWD